MLDVYLIHAGGGALRPASKMDFELITGSVGPNEKVRAKITKRRSVQQNEFFHALIEAAFENQRGGPNLPTWRHLKSWLLIKAGWCDVYEFPPDAMTPQVAAILRRVFDTVDFTTDGKKIWLKVARSVRFHGGADSDEMREIVDQIVEIITTEIVPGVKPDDLLNMARDRVKNSGAVPLSSDSERAGVN